MRRLFLLGAMVLTGLLAACSSDSSGTCGTGGAGGRATAGAGGQATAGAGGQATAGAGGQATAGAGGQATAGAGGQATAGAGGQATAGAGGQATGCLDASTFSSFFSISDPTFCAVAVYTAPASLGFQAPTWGTHGGPLVVLADAAGTGVTLQRWTAPAASTGAMTVQTTPVAAALPANTFLGAQAVDLPFFGWTAISWTKPFPDTTGKFEMITGGAVAASADVNGPFGMAAVAAAPLGRVFYSGLSPLGTPATSKNGLYVADACSSPSPALGTGTGCPAPALVAAWGENSGPVVADAQGDLFAVMNSMSTNSQEARGFLASSVAPGAPATDGVPLFTLAGFSGSLAALAPTATLPGVVVFQPFDSTTFDALDVIQQRFTTGSSLAATGAQAKLLTVTAAQTLSFIVDGADRLWVAASGTTSTTYVVLARR